MAQGEILSSSIEYLKGVGPAKADLLKTELSIHTFEDLLTLFPFRYIDKSKIYKVSELTPSSDLVQLKGKLIDLKEIASGRVKRLEGTIQDGSGIIKLVWFRSIKWIEKSLEIGAEYLIFGKVNDFNGRFSIPHPELERVFAGGPKTKKSFDPVYSATEKLTSRGLDAKGIRKLLSNFFEKYPPTSIPETLPDYLITRLKLIGRYEALHTIHFPSTRQKLEQARKRLKFEEFFLIQISILHRRQKEGQRFKGIQFTKVGQPFNTFFNSHLAFELTNAQKRVLKEIRHDMGQQSQMNRLLQGDVGSGKTIVGLMAMLLAKGNGHQSCMMAPTEVLAKQHLLSLREMLGDMEVVVEFLSGSIKGKARKDILERLVKGEIDILVGTHALIEDWVKFKSLGLAITDEQHRFGVAQRARLWKKGKENPPHILVMTATPIPRTLAMTVYGDLQVSIIDEMPPGRQEIKTLHRKDAHRMLMNAFIKKEIAKGRQIFFVYPLIEESSKLDLQNLLDGYDQMLEYFPRPQYQISVVHGRLKSKDKDLEMTKFSEGKTNIMVATTVIEVGVNIANATVMVIENAERFGLSQLHQLRGRVGRGGSQSYCILMTSDKLSKSAYERMKIMTSTNDGFEIAEADLKLRGPGNIEGTRQSGVLNLKIGDIVQDSDIITSARNIAQRILDDDPKLTKKQNQALYEHVNRGSTNLSWGQIS